MMYEEGKQNSSDLLTEIKKQKQRGQLKIFFGISPGVGKTYSMLKEAQQKFQNGVNVVIGTINTHGRKETEALLQGIPVISEKEINYRNVILKELDLESVLNRKPALILIDELAHTNVPGSKHSKRWEDVVEILDAGINVYTTLNIQHIESQKDVVKSLIGIPISETVPDFILERAASIEFVDISPTDLLERLKEGKIYLGDQSSSAVQNFFREKNIRTLREIALRFRDEKVEANLALHHNIPGEGWKIPERLMVAISPDPDSEQLIRVAKRLSLELDAAWIAVYIDRGITLSNQDQTILNKNIHLARELGAEVIMTHDLDIFAAIQRITRQKDITRLIISRQLQKKISFKRLLQGDFFNHLESENRYVDILIRRDDKFTDIHKKFRMPLLLSPWEAYRLTLVFGLGVTVFGFLISPILGYKSVGFIFLLGIVILSCFVGRGPILLAAFLSALCWKFFFIAPKFTLTISDPEDIILVIIYFFVAGIMGTLTSRMHEKEQFLQQREERLENLYEIERVISSATDFQNLRLNVSTKLENIFCGNFDILIKNQDNKLIFDSKQPLLLEEKEKATANWVFQNGEIAGWSTNTLPLSKGLYFPLKVSKSTVGILVYYPREENPLLIEELDFLQTVTQQLGIYLRVISLRSK